MLRICAFTLSLLAALTHVSDAIGQVDGDVPAKHGEAEAQRAGGFPGARSARTLLVGRVLSPDGTPATGAVVVSDVGGQVVTGGDGSFHLDIAVPEDLERVRVTAFVGSGTGGLVGSAQIGWTPWGTTDAGTFILQQASDCEPGWLPTFGQTPGVSGDVLALAVFDDGSGPALHVGGSFGTAGGVTASLIAKWDGTSWSALGSGLTGPINERRVNALAVFDDGSGPALYAGGEFTSAGGVGAVNIAKWDGANWSALLGGMDRDVYSLAVFDDGTGSALFAGGAFDFADDVEVKSIARWNGTTWSALDRGMDGFSLPSVRSLAVFDDGTGSALFAGGDFTSAGGVAASHIAKWNGSDWSALGDGVGGVVNPIVNALAVFDAGGGPALFAGGDFELAGGVTARRIAMWNGSTWSAVGTGMSTGVVHALAVFDDGSGPGLFAGGLFANAGGVAVKQVAKWNGSVWAKLGSGLNDSAHALVTFDDGSGPALYAGGAFLTAGGSTANRRIAKWDGSSWSSLGNGFGSSTTPSVEALAVFDDGSGPALYAGGDFTFIGDVTLNRIAKWNGSSWSNLGSGLNGRVRALTVFDSGSGPALYAGGDFTTAGGNTANRIARWNGTSWSALGTGMNGSVFALAVFNPGSGPALHAAGQFSTAGGTTVNRIAKWSGTTWSGLSGGMTSGDVKALAVFDDGGGTALYAAGNFLNAGVVSVNRIAKWNGSAWSALGNGLWAFQFLSVGVAALTVHDDGSGPALYAGGDFDFAGGTTASGIAKWDGADWYEVGTGTGDTVYVLSVFDDGSGPGLYAGGSFNDRILKWNGTSWSTLGGGLNGSVQALTTFDDGTGPALHAGGSFTSAVDSLDSHLAKWAGCPAGPPVWTDLGSALPGTAGAPLLVGTGDLSTGSGGALTLSNAAPASLSLLLISMASTPVPFKCGTLVAFPFFFTLTLPTSPGGSLVLPWAAWPAGLSGFSLRWQFAVQDAGAICGVALSNAVQADVP